ncbi:MAG TPA: 2-amino-4-hydroxy-6-hydroxymethyldihydropteridine diphosphokinase [Chitinophagaceae bacterium]
MIFGVGLKLMNNAYLLLGGNIGNREKNFEQAKNLIRQYCGEIVQSSSLYETAAWGKTNQPSFLNQALQLGTELNAPGLMEEILKIEEIMGRKRKEKYGPRIIDIDILLFNDEQYNDPFLKIPHPEMQNRRFALMPLAEIAGNIKHPVLKKSIFQLLEECKDELPVKKFQADD